MELGISLVLGPDQQRLVDYQYQRREYHEYDRYSGVGTEEVAVVVCAFPSVSFAVVEALLREAAGYRDGPSGGEGYAFPEQELWTLRASWFLIF
jgi:hypothetical protein